ncbi:hypothetical protein AVEN_27839-1 [Araneus ventricosus]|uniref:Uncharacterized protein n=1 Tax=Araneus ventricosus TaxID=182803 RepID=A0A4Y2GPG7_ARAVE|nr:hypothetical protein AVEN_27839-1 [Araneus ventricosus]
MNPDHSRRIKKHVYTYEHLFTSCSIRLLLTLAPHPILPRNFKILKSSSKWHVTSISEELTVYHIQRYEFSQQQQLLFTGTSSCCALTTIPQDPDELPPTQPLPPTTAADHLIPRNGIIQHHQLNITGD